MTRHNPPQVDASVGKSIRVDVEAIRARCEAAPRPPWTWREPGEGDVRPRLCDGEGNVIVADDWPCEGANLAYPLIAHARTDLPDAIAELTTTRAILADALAEAGRLRVAGKQAIEALETVTEFSYHEDDMVRSGVDADGDKCWAAERALRAALEVKQPADAQQAQIDALAVIENAKELVGSAWFTSDEAENLVCEVPPSKLAALKAALEVQP